MKNSLKQFTLTIFGSIVMAFGTGTFLLPNKLSTGGFTGLATIFYYYLKFPMSTSIILMNLPLFIIAYFRIRQRIFI